MPLPKYEAKNLPDKDKDTPLHYAAKKGHEEVVKLLLENDIDVNIKGSIERTALHYAAESGHKDLVVTLLKHRARHLPDMHKNTPLHYAAEKGHENIVKLFLENNVDINIKGLIELTALHYAAESGHKDLVLTLLRYGAKHLPDKDKDTPLHYAAKNGHKDVVKLLLGNNVDVNIKGYRERTALHYAAVSGNTDLVLTLLKHGAKHFPDKGKDTPLHYAAECRHEGVVRLFLESDIDVNIKGYNEQTALHYAARSGLKDLVLTLLRHGAKHLPDKDNDTPLHCAAENGHEDVVKLFLENNVDVNIKGCIGMTALHYAVQTGHTNTIVTLIKNGADTDLKNDEDKTALDLAQHQKDIIKLLTEKLVKN